MLEVKAEWRERNEPVSLRKNTVASPKANLPTLFLPTNSSLAYDLQVAISLAVCLFFKSSV